MQTPGCLPTSLVHARVDDPELDRLLEPGRHYRHPQDVLADQNLSTREKRAILSYWASDACAVESLPQLRWPQGAPDPVAFDDIMDALKTLDTIPCAAGQPQRSKRRSRQTGNDCSP